jgi:murein DD-endopeptidase MepM/ murein hydrolase activator NlpD
MPSPEAAPLEPVEKNNLMPIMPATVASQPLEPPPQAAPPPAQPPPPIVPPPSSAVQPSAAPPDAVQGLNRQTPPKQVATTAVVAPAPAAVSAPAPLSSDVAADVAAADVSQGIKWPVQGPILSSFGPKGSGLNNDGINIGAPKGSPVVASASGTVIYAGDEMKGFGNLVLIKHQGDMVTAYAHLDRVLVKKDSAVAQGDMIGTVGKTGNVPSPQLHFEVRQSGKPVDPAQAIKASL